MAALEQEFGLTLIDRATRPVRPTEAGERLREHAALVLGQVATAEEELRAFAGLLTGTVRVGAFLTACTSFVPPALARFEAAHPDVKIELEQLAAGARRCGALRAGELDVAVDLGGVRRGRSRDEGFERLFLGDDPYRIVLPAGHRLARRRELRMADLAGERFNGPAVDPGGRYRAMLDSVFAEAGLHPRRRLPGRRRDRRQGVRRRGRERGGDAAARRPGAAPRRRAAADRPASTRALRPRRVAARPARAGDPGDDEALARAAAVAARQPDG